MPIAKTPKPISKINVRFECEEDFQAFAKLINQKLTHRTKEIWYPKIKNEDLYGFIRAKRKKELT